MLPRNAPLGAVIVASLFAFAGCSTLTTRVREERGTAHIHVDAVPKASGDRIYVDGDLVGDAPTDITVPFAHVVEETESAELRTARAMTALGAAFLAGGSAAGAVWLGEVRQSEDTNVVTDTLLLTGSITLLSYGLYALLTNISTWAHSPAPTTQEYTEPRNINVVVETKDGDVSQVIVSPTPDNVANAPYESLRRLRFDRRERTWSTPGLPEGRLLVTGDTDSNASAHSARSPTPATHTQRAVAHEGSETSSQRSEHSEHLGRTERTQSPQGTRSALDADSDGSTDTAGSAPRTGPTIVAVFDVEDRGVEVDHAVLGRLSDYLAARIASQPEFRIVPRADIKSRLLAAKNKSYDHCYDEACQIEIGKELAAQSTLSTMLARIGDECVLTSVVYDLRRATSVGGTSVSGGCEERAFIGLVNTLVAQLRSTPSSNDVPDGASP
ncbi:MAG: hypothetical protein H6729_12515 [Deltaproteobacteria bacterium]|nr:hypothetical protein [Deltaproteobacteria bacterium]